MVSLAFTQNWSGRQCEWRLNPVNPFWSLLFRLFTFWSRMFSVVPAGSKTFMKWTRKSSRIKPTVSLLGAGCCSVIPPSLTSSLRYDLPDPWGLLLFVMWFRWKHENNGTNVREWTTLWGTKTLFKFYVVCLQMLIRLSVARVLCLLSSRKLETVSIATCSSCRSSSPLLTMKSSSDKWPKLNRFEHRHLIGPSVPSVICPSNLYSTSLSRRTSSTSPPICRR